MVTFNVCPCSQMKWGFPQIILLVGMVSILNEIHHHFHVAMLSRIMKKRIAHIAFASHFAQAFLHNNRKNTHGSTLKIRAN